jgi:uncharacterized repeat protein (TIGR03803 family)
MSCKSFLMPLLVMCVSLAIVPGALALSNEQKLRNFNDTHGYWGTSPSSALAFDSAGNLYGTTATGGANHSLCKGNGCGTVFELIPGTNGKWSEKLLHSFNGKDGMEPTANLILDAAGNIYGTTFYGGDLGCRDGGGNGCGAVFELIPGANGKWAEKVLHRFGGKDGFTASAALVFDAKGNLYGTTLGGGAYGGGTVFELTPNGTGQWTESLLYSFSSGSNNGGFNPYSGVIFDTQGNLYGTAVNGGTYNHGAVFELSPGANGQWTEKVLHIFGYRRDGFYPYGGLVFDAAGNLYGTGYDGGTYGYGAIFQMTPGTDGQWTETVLYNFGSRRNDGWLPVGNLIFDPSGNLYGSTYAGGVQSSACDNYGCGTVFELSPGANGTWTEQVLHRFGKGKDGANPQFGPILDSTGNLYGTTPLGGTYGYGTAFKITP